MNLSLEDVRFESVPFRAPLKFGTVVLTETLLAVVTIRLSAPGREGIGIGAMPLGNAWSFPAAPYDQSLDAMQRLTARIARSIAGYSSDSIFDLSHQLEQTALRDAQQISDEMPDLPIPIPKLCALVGFSPFDLALFDAWGKMHGANTFDLIRQTPEGDDLAPWLDEGFRGYGLKQVVRAAPVESLPVFHLVGGLDPLTAAEVDQPIDDGLPEHLKAWIEKDQLTHFKIKLGADSEWNYQRIIAVDRIVSRQTGGEPVYSLDFNELCPSGQALVDLLQRVKAASPVAFGRIAYVEQPTSRELLDRDENNMHAAARLKPVVIDEALTDYSAFCRARALGYSGVALKACKGIGPSLLMAAACRRQRLFLCVQDLTCPGRSLLESASLAAWLGVAAIEANARQFCPAANADWARRQPDVFTIQAGRIRTGGLNGPGLGFD